MARSLEAEATGDEETADLFKRKALFKEEFAKKVAGNHLRNKQFSMPGRPSTFNKDPVYTALEQEYKNSKLIGLTLSNPDVSAMFRKHFP